MISGHNIWNRFWHLIHRSLSKSLSIKKKKKQYGYNNKYDSARFLNFSLQIPETVTEIEYLSQWL